MEVDGDCSADDGGALGENDVDDSECDVWTAGIGDVFFRTHFLLAFVCWLVAFEEARVPAGLTDWGGLEDDREVSKEDGGALGIGLEQDAVVVNDGDGLQWEVGGSRRDADGFTELEGAWGDSFDEGIAGIGDWICLEDGKTLGAWANDSDEEDDGDGLEKGVSGASDRDWLEEDAGSLGVDGVGLVEDVGFMDDVFFRTLFWLALWKLGNL